VESNTELHQLAQCPLSLHKIQLAGEFGRESDDIGGGETTVDLEPSAGPDPGSAPSGEAGVSDWTLGASRRVP